MNQNEKTAEELAELDMLDQLEGKSNPPRTVSTPAAPAAPADPAVPASAGASPATPATPATPVVASTFRDDLIKGLVAKGVTAELPEDLTAENWLDVVGPLLAPKLAPQLSPEAMEVQAAIAQGMTVDQYYEQRTRPDRLIGMSDEDLYKLSLTEQYGKSEANPDGWDPEKVQRIVDAKKASNDVELLAEEIRMKLRADKAKYQDEMQKRAASYAQASSGPSQDFNDPKVVEQFNAAVQEASSELVKEGKFYGIDLGKVDDQKNLVERTQRLLRPDPKTGRSITDERIANNNGYVRMALLLDMAESGELAKGLDEKGNAFVQSLLGKLELTPGTQAGASRPSGDKIDIDRLSRPGQVLYGKPS